MNWEFQFYQAVEADNELVADSMLSEAERSGVQIRSLKIMEYPAAFLAAELGAKKCLRVLVNHGVDINKTFGARGLSVLHYAIAIDSEKCLDSALSVDGIDPNVTNIKKETPLHWASKNSMPDAIGKLLRAGADINAVDGAGFTPLHYASARDHFETVEMLIQNGADTHQEDEHGRTAVDIAELKGRNDISFRLLMEQENPLPGPPDPAKGRFRS